MKAGDVRTFKDLLEWMGPPSTFVTMELLRGPIVYVVVSDHGDTVEYVGSSGVGLARPFGRDHHVIRDLPAGCGVAVWPMKSESDARLIEDSLIVLLSPQRNQRVTPGARALLGPA